MTVIGPIPYEDWNTMRLLRSSVAWMKQNGNPQYGNAIEKEDSLYRKLLKEVKIA
jgi:hypothetical protein